jgi:hypothetical protein
MIQENLLPYNQESFRESFTKTELYKKIEADHDYIIWEKFYTHWVTSPSKEMTPRHKSVTRAAPVGSFYYLQYLLDTNPRQIVDLGCGDNWFKKYIPNIWGIDGLNPGSPHYKADQHTIINDSWIQYNASKFDCLMSINALHFKPLEKIRETTVNAMKLLRRGRGFLAFNVARFLEKSETGLFSELVNSYNRPTNSVESWKPILPKLEEYIRTELYNLPASILVFDLDLTYLEDGMDGNLRIVFEK